MIWHWAALVGSCFVLVYVLGPIDHDFANMMPAVFIFGGLYLAVREYDRRRKAQLTNNLK